MLPISVPPTPAETHEPARPFWINVGERPSWLDTESIIATYVERSGGAVRFVAELAVFVEHRSFYKTGKEWTTNPVAVFWQERLVDPSHSHYFGLYRDGGNLMICSAQTAASAIWGGGMHPGTGEIVFSRFRHDFRKPADESFFVDGGQDYGRFGGKFIPVSLRIEDGLWRIHKIADTIDVERTKRIGRNPPVTDAI